jgi:hypothetical protein
MVVFVIVGSSDPVYELEIGAGGGNRNGTAGNELADETRFLHQFTMFSSLDMINSTMWSNHAM